jgi:anti-sigma regulatory factor (Ser/Thr protein kinase)/anti-anti-sigma regulatory factor
MTGTRHHSRDGPGPVGLTSRVERHAAVLVLALHGRIELADAATVRARVLECLGDFPTALVIDMSGLQVSDDEALAVPAALQDAGGWPPVPVVLCAPDLAMVERLERLPFAERPHCYRTRDGALAAAAAAGHVADRFTATLPATPQAPAQSRALLNRACRVWRLTDLAPAAEVILSELCANVVVHARTTMRIIIHRTPEAMYIVVRDADPTPPQPRSLPRTGAPADSGNGLQLVDAFATDWGTMPTTDGKAVWASLRIGEVG